MRTVLTRAVIRIYHHPEQGAHLRTCIRIAYLGLEQLAQAAVVAVLCRIYQGRHAVAFISNFHVGLRILTRQAVSPTTLPYVSRNEREREREDTHTQKNPFPSTRLLPVSL